MNRTTLTFRSPLSARTAWTPFDGMDITSGLALVEVTAPGDQALSTPSSGWTLVATAKSRSGNLQAGVIQTTTASFAKDSPSVESFEVDSVNATVFSAILHLLNP